MSHLRDLESSNIRMLYSNTEDAIFAIRQMNSQGCAIAVKKEKSFVQPRKTVIKAIEVRIRKLKKEQTNERN
jgi:hypothetical protein